MHLWFAAELHVYVCVIIIVITPAKETPTLSYQMLHRWLKFIEQSTTAMDDGLAKRSRAAAKWQQSSSLNALNSGRGTVATSGSPSPSPPPNTPFRKKAITSIERTRKLSILLKHQRYLVSLKLFLLAVTQCHKCIHTFSVQNSCKFNACFWSFQISSHLLFVFIGVFLWPFVVLIFEQCLLQFCWAQ